ncbi:MAG: bifunctional metallophosphatase/5'-nucleotidase, partial [Anaerolineae bacterium]|nr:bifunctional metallophosphatase/5'-nucleotidase [Anaerolineae bacterium]
ILAALLLPGVAAQEEETFPLTIMHTNDTHAAHVPNGDGNGGVAIQAAVVNQIRAQAENTVLLDAGDRFTGTLFHTVYEGQDQPPIMNQLGYSAMTLGNHEFDKGDEILANFIKRLEFPVVNANTDFSGSAFLADLIQPYAILDVNGEKVGIIGLTTADTTFSSSPSDELVWRDDYTAVVAEQVEALNAEGVDKIILITHMGINADLPQLADLVGVDVVIGGHSHTLFSNAYTGAFDAYPVEAETTAGEPILYVQTGSLNLYLGRLDVEFDANGVLTGWEGDTILLSGYITPDPDMADLIEELSGPVTALQEEPTGASSDVLLVGDRAVCRVQECNMGNLIADAMRAETGAQISIMNGGGVRASIEPGDINFGEVLTVQPFGNTISTFA